MNNLGPTILVLISVFLFGCQSKTSETQDYNSTDSKLAIKLDEYFNALIKLKEFNGVVLVEKDGKVVLSKAYNLSSDINNSLFVTTEHQFDLRSISKLIAKYAVIKLQEVGKLSEEDTISKYIQNFPNGDKITLKHLLANQSGLPREFTDEDINFSELEPKEIIELIKKEPLEFSPGTETRYSNLGFQIVYYIIGKVTSQTFAQHVQDEIYKPLNMNSSGAHYYTDNKNLNKFAAYHTKEANNIIRIPHQGKDSKRQAKLFSTSSDLVNLLDAFKKPPYSSKMINSKNVIGHSGGSDGIRSHIQANIPGNYSFIFLANYDQIPFADIVKTIEDIMEGRDFIIPIQINRTSIVLTEKQIEKYIGRYDFKDADHIIFDISIQDGQLFALQKGQLEGIVLYPENDSLFFWAPDDSQSMEFRLDTNGNYKLIADMFGAPWEGTKIE